MTLVHVALRRSIRGVVEMAGKPWTESGDGCISCYNQRPYLQIAGTEKLLSWIRNYFDRWYPPIGRYHSSVRKKSGIYSYQLTGERARIAISDLNKTRKLKLDRKWSKACL